MLVVEKVNIIYNVGKLFFYFFFYSYKKKISKMVSTKTHRRVFQGRKSEFKVRKYSKEYQRIRNKLKVQNERELLIRNDQNQWIPYVPTSSSPSA